MDAATRNNLDEFLSDIGFPIDKTGLVQESHEFPLADRIRDAIALLPEKEYASREELKRELVQIPFDDENAKKEDIGEDIDEIDDPADALDTNAELDLLGGDTLEDAH